MPDLDDFSDWLYKRGRARSASQYCKVVRRWLEDPDEIEDLIVSPEKSPNYRRFVTACIRSWARFTKDGDLSLRLEDIRQPPAVPVTEREPFDFDEWIRIRDSIEGMEDLSEPEKCVCSIIAIRGIRCGDVLRLTRKDVNAAIKKGILRYEAKGGRWLRFSATPFMEQLEQLAGMKWPGERVRNLICPGGADDCQDSAGRVIRRCFDEIADYLSIPREDLYAHRFRHTYATYFLREMKGDPEAIFKLQQQMGWARLDTTANYIRGDRQAHLDEIESRLLSRR